MKLFLIGIYGTETIGDRAIFCGLLNIFSKSYEIEQIIIASQAPFYTRRMIFEDQDLYKVNLSKIEIIDSTSYFATKKAIKQSDVLIYGGGPIMDMPEIDYYDYVFSHKNKIKLILGCGFGPVSNDKYIRPLRRFFSNAHFISMRDNASKRTAQDFLKLGPEVKMNIDCDLSIQSLIEWKSKQKANVKQNNIAVNVRAFSSEYGVNGEKINHFINSIVNTICEQTESRVSLIPMHYFFIGNDDREFMNEIKYSLGHDKLSVQNEPLTLSQTYEKFFNAEMCVGMRYHSIIFQTILNGKNLALNYTDSKNGKIKSFFNDNLLESRYHAQYIDLQSFEDVKSIMAKDLSSEALEDRLSDKVDNLVNNLIYLELTK